MTAGVLSVVFGAGCLGTPAPFAERAEFRALQDAAPSRPDVTVIVDVQAGDLEAPPSGEKIRAASVAPSTEAQAKLLVEALTELGAFGEVRLAGSAEDTAELRRGPAVRLVVRPRRSEVEYTGMHPSWPLSLAAWWITGPPGWFVPDEQFEARVGWELEARTGSDEQIAAKRVDEAFDATLNDFDRGFHLWDILVYYVRPIDEGVLERVGGKMLPHSEAKAAVDVCRWMVEEVLPQLPAAEETPVPPDPTPDPPPDPTPDPPPGATPDPDTPETPESAPESPEPGTPETTAIRHHVLCVGIEKYADDPDAAFARADAEAAAAALTERLELQPGQVTTLLDSAATLDALRGWIDRTSKLAVKPNDHVWIFFAGRGATDRAGQPLLVPHGAKAASASTDDSIALGAIATMLKGAGRVNLLLDCAFQGRREQRGPGPGGRSPVSAGELLTPNVIALTAAYATGEAHAKAGLGHGLFTEALRNGLGGEADADGDGRLTAKELAEYLKANVTGAARLQGVTELPQLIAGDPGSILCETGK